MSSSAREASVSFTVGSQFYQKDKPEGQTYSGGDLDCFVSLQRPTPKSPRCHWTTPGPAILNIPSSISGYPWPVPVLKGSSHFGLPPCPCPSHRRGTAAGWLGASQSPSWLAPRSNEFGGQLPSPPLVTNLTDHLSRLEHAVGRERLGTRDVSYRSGQREPLDCAKYRVFITEMAVLQHTRVLLVPCLC